VIAYLDLSQTAQAAMTLGVVAVMFFFFIREVYPTEVVALAGAAAMLALGLLPYDAALNVLSNPAPWTIAVMFIVMGALVRTGALEAFTSLADRHARSNPKLAVAMMLGLVIFGSAVMNNTPVVVVMIPVFVQLARTMKIPAC